MVTSKARRTPAKRTAKRPAGRGKSAKTRRVEIGGISLSSPERVVYPEAGITKLELAEYYETAFDRLLPHFRNRPLTLVRCPDTYKRCFFQKHIDDNTVYEHVNAIPIREEKGVSTYCSIDSLEGLLSLVQLGVVEFHTWGSRSDRLENPDKFTIDLDPDPSVPWARVVNAALTIRELLRELALTSFAKTTGGKGLHVVVPIARRRSWAEVRAFTEAIAGMMVEAAPKEFVMTFSKAKRRGKILVDYLRNARGAIAVEAYSARARAGATVSKPIAWDELTPQLDPQEFTVRTMKNRLARGEPDPWSDYFDIKQSITAAMLKRVGAAVR